MTPPADATASLSHAAGPGRFARRILTVIGLVLLALAVATTLWLASEVVLTVLAGILGAVLLDGAARWIAAHTPMGRGAALAAVIVLLVTAFGVFGVLAAPSLSDEIGGLGTQLRDAVTELRETLSGYPGFSWALENVDPQAMFSRGSTLVGRVGGVVFAAIGAIGTLLLAIVFAVYLAATPDVYLDGMIRLAPVERRERLREVMGAIGHALRRWFVGRFVSMAVVGIGTGIGLWIAGVPMAALLGVLAGVLSFIPNLGPILSGAPGLLIAWTQSLSTALWALAVYVGVQLIDNYVVTPFVQQRAVSLPPAVLLAVQLLMGVVAGLLGLTIATPLAVIVIVAVQMLYVRDLLGDPVAPLAEKSP